MRNIKKIFIISFLILVLVYVSNISSIPSNIILLQGEKLYINTVFGLSLQNKDDTEKYDTIQTSSTINTDTNKIGKVNLKLSLFNRIPLKDVSLNIIPKTSVVPLGNLVGLKLYTSGVLVVGMSEIEGSDNKKYKPYENTGIEEGDMIIKVAGNTVTCTADLLENVNESKGEKIDIVYVRDGETIETNIIPVKTGENKYKLGLWVRDAAAGVGTVSFYEPSTQTFAALGHGIQDVDTGKLLDIAKGEFVTTKIVSITKGETGNPGKIQGTIQNSTEIGEVYKNTEFGVYGKAYNTSKLNIDVSEALEVATRDEIKTGPAKIICTLENNKKKEYDIEIEKIYKYNNDNNKSMLIKVTDKELIEKTGGIIQGMSGSPIIQNNKVVGALTHVLVNDPQTGYGVFADLMIKQMKMIE